MSLFRLVVCIRSNNLQKKVKAICRGLSNTLSEVSTDNNQISPGERAVKLIQFKHTVFVIGTWHVLLPTGRKNRKSDTPSEVQSEEPSTKHGQTNRFNVNPESN